MRILPLTLLAFSLLLSSANASTVEGTVRSGKSISLSGEAVYDYSRCMDMRMRAKVRKQPSHGRVEITKTTYKISKKSRCTGRPFVHTGVKYTADPGYSGPDQFAVDYYYSGVSGRNTNYRVNYKIKVE